MHCLGLVWCWWKLFQSRRAWMLLQSNLLTLRSTNILVPGAIRIHLQTHSPHIDIFSPNRTNNNSKWCGSKELDTYNFPKKESQFPKCRLQKFQDVSCFLTTQPGLSWILEDWFKHFCPGLKRSFLHVAGIHLASFLEESNMFFARIRSEDSLEKKT